MDPKEQVRRFYARLWNAHDKTAIPQVLSAEVTFRGSLGAEKRGHAGFAEYVDGVHAALGDYHCEIIDLLREGSKVFARMSFSGVHRGPLLGYPATGCRVDWDGCALFTFEGDLIRDVWVLGDLKGLEARLAEARKTKGSGSSN